MQQSDVLAPERTRTASPGEANHTTHGKTARVIPFVPMSKSETEVARQMQICNACRYLRRLLRRLSGDDAPPRIWQGGRQLSGKSLP